MDLSRPVPDMRTRIERIFERLSLPQERTLFRRLPVATSAIPRSRANGTRIRRFHELSRLAKYVPDPTVKDGVSADPLAVTNVSQPGEMVTPPSGWKKGRPWRPIGFFPQKGPAFSGAPKAQDVAQGPIGDCWMLAALCAFAANDPASLVQRVREIDDHTFGITLTPPGETVPREVIIDSSQPKVETSATNIIGSHARVQNNVIWPLLFEKAFATIMPKGYESIGHGEIPSKAVSALSNEDAFDILTSKTPTELQKSIFELAIARKIPVVVVIKVGQDNRELATSKDVGDVGMVHAFWLKGYDPVTDTVKLGNPWGPWADPQDLTFAELQQLMIYSTVQNIWTGGGATAIGTPAATNYLISNYSRYSLERVIKGALAASVETAVGIQVTRANEVLAQRLGLPASGISQYTVTSYDLATKRYTLLSRDASAPLQAEVTLDELRELGVVLSTATEATPVPRMRDVLVEPVHGALLAGRAFRSMLRKTRAQTKE